MLVMWDLPAQHSTTRKELRPRLCGDFLVNCFVDVNGLKWEFFSSYLSPKPHRVQRCGHGRLVPAEILQLLRSLPTHMHERTSMTEQANEVHEIHIVRSDRTFA